uniref:Uncharacterized protein n=1 Tax=Salix viminalis TaxID=40686 RepID=A0A6N2NKE8_SALVM
MINIVTCNWNFDDYIGIKQKFTQYPFIYFCITNSYFIFINKQIAREKRVKSSFVIPFCYNRHTLPFCFSFSSGVSE